MDTPNCDTYLKEMHPNSVEGQCYNEVQALKDRERELMSLVDGAKPVVELFVPKWGEAQKTWRKEWLSKANKLLEDK